MELLFPHRVEYEVPDTVAIEDVIGTLQANQRLVYELGEFLNTLFDGLTVEHASIRVQTISTGSLKEYFFLALVVAFQDDLKREVPAALHDWFGVLPPEHYNTLITICVMMLLFYGGDYLYKRVIDNAGSKILREQLDFVIAELAIHSQRSEAHIRKNLEHQFAKPRKRKELAKAAVKFFRPSRVQQNGPILIGDRQIDPPTIAQIPYQIDIDKLQEGDRYSDLNGVRIEFHAKDRDKGDAGWACIVPTVSDLRIKMQLYPDIPPGDLWECNTAWADIKVVYRTDKNGIERPILIYLIRLLEGPNPKP
ncbi:conserved hypothetical protein [Hyphomicrobium sp. GJ21]|uniref:hypothetical protein n=1 Tax=Hyphomicrobium sp. GJ21 TaxID=113574 RepID=UPI000622BC2F|nr:hypothetical protein [Hyphomicrobium sp. GJ21]CEJ83877.1 conserved hypothetical protein [Hyphomicrobium sp. GJ21]